MREGRRKSRAAAKGDGEGCRKSSAAADGQDGLDAWREVGGEQSGSRARHARGRGREPSRDTECAAVAGVSVTSRGGDERPCRRACSSATQRLGLRASAMVSMHCTSRAVSAWLSEASGMAQHTLEP